MVRYEKLIRVTIVVSLIALTVDSSVSAQVNRQEQEPGLTQTMLLPNDTNIQALKTLIHHYKLESQFNDPRQHSLVIDHDNYEAIVFGVINYFDQLIAAGNANSIREEDLDIIQKLRTAYTDKFIAFRAPFDYENAAFLAKKQSLFGDTSDSSVTPLSREASALLLTRSPCFHPTFLQPDSVDVQVLRGLAKRYNVALPIAKSSPIPTLLENRPIARHEFAAALDSVLMEALERFKTNPTLIPWQDRAVLQQLYNSYEIELTSSILLGATTKLYTYCLN